MALTFVFYKTLRRVIKRLGTEKYYLFGFFKDSEISAVLLHFLRSFFLPIVFHFHKEIQQEVLIVGKCVGKSAPSLAERLSFRLARCLRSSADPLREKIRAGRAAVLVYIAKAVF